MLNESIKKCKVLIGNDEYNYIKDGNNEERLTRNEIINGKNIEIVLKSGGNEDPKEIEKFITDVLSDLYIKKMMKKFN